MHLGSIEAERHFCRSFAAWRAYSDRSIGMYFKLRRSISKKKSGTTPRSNRAIDYTIFGPLSAIITSNRDIFGSIFTSPRAVRKVMVSLRVARTDRTLLRLEDASDRERRSQGTAFGA